MLSNFIKSRGVFHRVKEVVVSSRINLGKLVTYIGKLPKTLYNEQFMHPDLKFKVIHSSSPVAAPPIGEHVHESFFSVDFTLSELISFHRDEQITLREKVKSEFLKKVSPLVELRQSAPKELPKDVMYVILPFLYGTALTTPMLNSIVAEVGDLLGKDINSKRKIATTRSARSKRKRA